MRGISILLVLILHFQLAYRLDQGFFASLLPEQWIRRFAFNGNYGVTLFFAISGFLITSTSLARFGELRRVDSRSFYSFRFARIVPNVVLMVGLVLALGAAGLQIFANDPGKASMRATLLSIATFTHNVLMREHGYFNYCLNILWSLSVEEAFYLAFPLVCLTLRRERLLVAFWVAVAAFAPIYRSWHREDEIAALYGYLSCFDAIAIGCLAAVASRRVTLPRRAARFVTAVASVVIAVVYVWSGIMANVVAGVSIVAFATGAILFSVGRGDATATPSRNPLLAGLAHLGRNSYELYLFHVVLLALMKTAVKRGELGYWQKPMWFAAYLVGSFVIAEIVARFFAEPLNQRLRTVLRRSSVSPLKTPAAEF